MDITGVRSHGGVKHMSKTKRIFWGFMICINIILLVTLGMAIDNKSKTMPVYDYAPAKAEMICNNDGCELVFNSLKTDKNGSYEIHGTCPFCHQKWTITYSPISRQVNKFLGE